MTPPPYIPSHPPPTHTHIYTHWLLLAINFLQSLVYTLCKLPLHPLYTLEEILLVVKPLDHHLWIHFSFEYCWHHFYDQ